MTKVRSLCENYSSSSDRRIRWKTGVARTGTSESSMPFRCAPTRIRPPRAPGPLFAALLSQQEIAPTRLLSTRNLELILSPYESIHIQHIHISKSGVSKFTARVLSSQSLFTTST